MNDENELRDEIRWQKLHDAIILSNFFSSIPKIIFVIKSLETRLKTNYNRFINPLWRVRADRYTLATFLGSILFYSTKAIIMPEGYNSIYIYV